MATNHPHAHPWAAVADTVSVVEELELAEPLSRLAAFFVDGIVSFVMIGLPALILVLATDGVAESNLVISMSESSTAWLLAALGLFSWAWITALLVARSGQTIGKRLLEIRVVRSDGSPASLGRIFWLRNVVNAFLGVIPLYGLVELLFIFGPRRRCVHDLIADTIVVRV